MKQSLNILLIGFLFGGILFHSGVYSADPLVGKGAKLPEWEGDDKKFADEHFKTPSFGSMVKPGLWAGGSIALTIYAFRKLKKDREAQEIKLKEQQASQSGMNPMMMQMMMQMGGGEGMPGFPGGPDVKSPFMGTPESADIPESAGSVTKPQLKAYEKDILSPAMRRFLTAVYWLGFASSIYNGIGFVNMAVAHTQKKDHGYLPAVIAGAHNTYTDGTKALNEMAPRESATSDSIYALMLLLDRYKNHPDIKKFYNLSMCKKLEAELEKAGSSKDGSIPFAKRELLAVAGQYVQNIRMNSVAALKNGWFARFSRAVFGHDIGSRALLSFQHDDLKERETSKSDFGGSALSES